MELNGDEPVMKSKALMLKFVARRFGCKAARSSKVWKSEEAYDEEVYDGLSHQEVSATDKKEQKILW